MSPLRRPAPSNTLRASSFHHDHYDPNDVQEHLLTAVLAEHNVSADNIWIFGFGSLVHTPGFAYADVKRGYIRGWKRVWWQGSTDHRGTVEYPGRTVTLTEEPDAWTWGVAYKLAGDAQQQRETLQYLEWREKQYDHRAYVRLYEAPREDAEVLLDTALCYVATSDTEKNPNYLGPASVDELAKQIATAVGPSGPNVEYLLKIRNAVLEARAAGSDVDELMALAERVERLITSNK
jgi:cation transport regulator ChaC